MSNLPPLRRISSPSQSASPHSVPTHSDQNNASTSAAPASTILQLNPQLQPDQETNTTSGVIGEPRKCFICLSEEGEESSTEGSPSETARWSKPCACSLDAHEACLIIYINRQRKDDPNKTVSCPQCKEPYQLKQNASLLYRAASYYNTRLTTLAPFIAGLGCLGTAYMALTIHGWYALCTFCGDQLAIRLFSESNWRRPSYIIRMLFGLQFIPVWLVASRTRYLDSVLPFVPLVFVEQDAVELVNNGSRPSVRWLLLDGAREEVFPPGLTVCLLPWARVIYNKLWDRWIVPLEKKWESDDVGSDSPPGVFDGRIVVEVGGMGNGNDNGQRQNRQQARNGGGGAAVAAAEDGDLDARGNRNRGDVIITTDIATLCRKVVGALLLPDICSLAGFLLGQIPWVRKKLPDRFSRNVMGGLLFLILKDAASLWFKYSAMKSRRSLRVLDYDPRRRGRRSPRTAPTAR